jgi:hypothetical protein
MTPEARGNVHVPKLLVVAHHVPVKLIAALETAH